ncbi:selenium cofactor biosynthesis protein YqeC [Wenzhouxiangella sp. XN24]|uniref:selenium cofactor biosynthesis protein YqeC n=1 Tax=Wenzhouxiangella sp. XN24 TaxID=2713569 RepID=UPI0013EA891D|nr:selenium cofactor biosynthesis protein YqeC [Wenzhouxiangella sp. XN24]NGX14948.1 putative selenium-dependent hydroxylase accessory protein YqeC [Wenzhouxiangella sp. XN24]
MTDLLDLLCARDGIVCTTGAGGKKSVLFAIAARHPGRIAFTTTVRTLPPPASLGARIVIAPEDRLEQDIVALGDARFVAYACPGSKPGRLAGVPPPRIDALHAALHFDITLVKADGARMRWVKAPSAEEPVLPPGITTLIPVLSARALGEPLSERTAHRVERLAAITGARAGEAFTPLHAARLMSSEEGLLKGAGAARIVPVINMVDDATRMGFAREAAERALEETGRFDYVVLARLKGAEPQLTIVKR